jgi:hypothetical protein
VQQLGKMLLQNDSKNTANIEIPKLCNLYKKESNDALHRTRRMNSVTGRKMHVTRELQTLSNRRRHLGKEYGTPHASNPPDNFAATEFQKKSARG